ncbi:MAG: hypothetical protein K6E40_15550 [Desulfovibrio sp.]|nr:hypothetical protein [Desulfovibrio sp.]
MPALGLFVPADGFVHVPVLLKAMAEMEPRGEFSPLSLLPVLISVAMGGFRRRQVPGLSGTHARRSRPDAMAGK